MDANTLISIARQGNRLGQFPLSAVRAGLTSGKFTAKDYFWVSGMSGWAPLDQLPTEDPPSPSDPELPEATPDSPGNPSAETAAPQPRHAPPPATPGAPHVARQPSAPPPPLPPALPADWRKTAGTILLTIGAVEFLYGLTTSPDGSAMRQQVLVQHMTNGLLFAILSLLVRKFK